MKIIDFRLRPPYKGFLNDWMFDLEDSPGHAGLINTYAHKDYVLPESLKKQSIEELLREMERSEIVAAAVPVRCLPGLDNDTLEELLTAYPGKFIGLAGFQPNHQVEKVLEDIQKYVVEGHASCVFMEPGIDKDFWFVDDEQFYPIYEKCQNNDIPIVLLYGGIFHRAEKGLDYNIYNPIHIEHVLADFPTLRMALSHAGLPWTTLACMSAWNYENLYLSPDFYLQNAPGCQDYIIGANGIIQDKIIFGSCYPAAPIDAVVNGYKEVLRPEVYEKVFYQNVLNFLGERIVREIGLK